MPKRGHSLLQDPATLGGWESAKLAYARRILPCVIQRAFTAKTSAWMRIARCGFPKIPVEFSLPLSIISFAKFTEKYVDAYDTTKPCLLLQHRNSWQKWPLPFEGLSVHFGTLGCSKPTCFLVCFCFVLYEGFTNLIDSQTIYTHESNWRKSVIHCENYFLKIKFAREVLLENIYVRNIDFLEAFAQLYGFVRYCSYLWIKWIAPFFSYVVLKYTLPTTK